MTVLDWRDRYAVRPMTETVTQAEDGKQTAEITDVGSRYQLVDGKIAECAATHIGKYFASLDDYAVNVDAYWYVRRDRWTFLFKATWKLMVFMSAAERQLLRVIHSSRCASEWHGFERVAWRTALKRHEE